MLDQLMSLVRRETPQALAGAANVPSEQQGAIQEEAAHSVYSGMQNIMQTQGPAGLKSLFAAAQHGDTANPQMQMLTNNFAGTLGQKFGLGGGMGKTIAMALIPMIISRVFNKTKDPNDNSFNIQDILGSLMGGGGSGGLGGMLGGNGGLGGMLGGAMSGGKSGGGMLGGALDRDGDGDTDLKDLMGMFR
jgi:hypothetical protein